MRYAKVMNKYHNIKGRPMKAHRLYKKVDKIHKKVYFMFFVFILLAVYYLLELLDVATTDIFRIEYIGIAALILVLIPLYHMHIKTTHKVLLTHDAIAYQAAFRQYKLMLIEDIQKAKITKKDTMKLKTKKHTFKIKLPKYDENLHVLKDIMNCEGHFKASKKPYKLFFEADGVKIQELTPKIDPETSRLIQAYHDEYKHVTPGFIDDFLLYKSTIEKVKFLQDRHMVFYLSHLDLKPDFPENTHFEAMKTDDAMLLFKDISHVEIFSLNQSKSSDVQLLGTSMNDLKKISSKTIIMETNFKALEEAYSCDMILMHGAKKTRAKFVFKDVITGFNKLEEVAWFQKT